MAVQVRLATTADAAGIRAIYAPHVEGSAVSFETAVPSVAEIASRIGQTLRTHPWLVAEDAAGVLGYAYAHGINPRAAYNWSVETSIYVRAESQRRGVGRTLYAAIFEALRTQGFRQAFAIITLPNPASVALHEALGFRPVGRYEAVGWKLGRWHDVGWWQRALTEDDSAPVELRGFEPLTSAMRTQRSAK